MNAPFPAKRQWFRRPWIIVSIIVVLTALVFVVTKKRNAEVRTVEVMRGVVTQEVSVTGTVKPAREVSLAFERTGRVRKVAAEVGESVVTGQSLIELDRAELDAELAQALARVALEQAKLDDLRNGTRPEELTVKEVELAKAVQDLSNDYVGAVDVVQDAYAKAEDAARAKVDGMFQNAESDNPSLTFAVSDSQAENDARRGRLVSRNALNEWKASLAQVTQTAPTTTLSSALAEARQRLQVVRDFLASALDAVSNAAGVSAATTETYKANVAVARTNVQTALTNVSAKEQEIAAQQVVVNRIQNELTLARAGATSDQIAAQTAAVRQANAIVDGVRAQIGKLVLRAPFAGVVTVQSAKLGELAVPNQTIMKIISKSQFQIEANIPEADIAKVSVGDAAKITLDAYGSREVFEATVAKIDPAETVVEGVATYKTTLSFVKEESKVRSGMTANIDIVTETREGVLVVPQWSLSGSGDTRAGTVRLSDGTSRAVSVRTGLRGSDGTIEVVEGVREGDVLSVPSSPAQ
jgi:RND family efflux transporter MFP subunit